MKELAVAVDQVTGASPRAFAEHFADGAASVPITLARWTVTVISVPLRPKAATAMTKKSRKLMTLRSTATAAKRSWL